jgi:hypothetical protein
LLALGERRSNVLHQSPIESFSSSLLEYAGKEIYERYFLLAIQTLDQAIAPGDLKIEGKKEAFAEFLGTAGYVPVLVQHRNAMSMPPDSLSAQSSGAFYLVRHDLTGDRHFSQREF